MTTTPDLPRQRHLRLGTFLPAIGLMAAAATQIDAAILTNAYRSASPAPRSSLNFPWYGGLAGQISTWWAFADLFLVVGFGAFARSRALQSSRIGRAGAWTATVAAAVLVVANFLSAANADAMSSDAISGVIGAMFGTATMLLGVGLTLAGVAVLRSGAWQGLARFIPVANGIWCFVMVGLIFGSLLQIAVGVMAALQVALGAALIAQET